MSPVAPQVRQCQLDELRVELVELAFTLECRGRPDAADLALAVAARISELAGGSTLMSPPLCDAVRMPRVRSLHE